MPVRDAMETGERPSAIVVPRGGRAGYCAYCEGLDNKRRRCRSRCPGWRCWLWLWLLLAGLLLSGPSWLVGQAGCWFSAAATHTQPGPASQCVCWLAPANQANQTPVRAKPTLGAAMAAQLHHAFPCCSSEQQCARRAPLRLNRVPSQSRRLDSFRIRNSSERFSSSGIFLLSVSARCQKNRALNWDLQGPIVLFILWHCAHAFLSSSVPLSSTSAYNVEFIPSPWLRSHRVGGSLDRLSPWHSPDTVPEPQYNAHRSCLRVGLINARTELGGYGIDSTSKVIDAACLPGGPDHPLLPSRYAGNNTQHLHAALLHVVVCCRLLGSICHFIFGLAGGRCSTLTQPLLSKVDFSSFRVDRQIPEPSQWTDEKQYMYMLMETKKVKIKNQASKKGQQTLGHPTPD